MNAFSYHSTPHLPFSDNVVTTYLPISTTILHPAISFYGPLFGILHHPICPLTFGSSVQLEIHYLDEYGNIQEVFYTGVRGTIYAVESLSTNYIEFIIRNEEPTGHRYAYLLVPGARRGYINMPLTFYVAWSQLHPFLSTTVWPGDTALTGSTPGQAPVTPEAAQFGNMDPSDSLPPAYSPPSSAYNGIVHPGGYRSTSPDSLSETALEMRAHDMAPSAFYGSCAGTGGPSCQVDGEVGSKEDRAHASGDGARSVDQVRSASE